MQYPDLLMDDQGSFDETILEFLAVEKHLVDENAGHHFVKQQDYDYEQLENLTMTFNFKYQSNCFRNLFPDGLGIFFILKFVLCVCSNCG